MKRVLMYFDSREFVFFEIAENLRKILFSKVVQIRTSLKTLKKFLWNWIYHRLEDWSHFFINDQFKLGIERQKFNPKVYNKMVKKRIKMWILRARRRDQMSISHHNGFKRENFFLTSLSLSFDNFQRKQYLHFLIYYIIIFKEKKKERKWIHGYKNKSFTLWNEIKRFSDLLSRI